MCDMSNLPTLISCTHKQLSWPFFCTLLVCDVRWFCFEKSQLVSCCYYSVHAREGDLPDLAQLFSNYETIDNEQQIYLNCWKWWDVDDKSKVQVLLPYWETPENPKPINWDTQFGSLTLRGSFTSGSHSLSSQWAKNPVLFHGFSWEVLTLILACSYFSCNPSQCVREVAGCWSLQYFKR